MNFCHAQPFKCWALIVVDTFKYVAIEHWTVQWTPYQQWLLNMYISLIVELLIFGHLICLRFEIRLLVFSVGRDGHMYLLRLSTKHKLCECLLSKAKKHQASATKSEKPKNSWSEKCLSWFRFKWWPQQQKQLHHLFC